MSTHLIDRESTSRPTPSDVRPPALSEVPMPLRNASSVKSSAPAAACKNGTNFNFEMPRALDKKGRPISDDAVVSRRQRRTWLGGAMMTVVVFSSVTFITASASTLMARVRLESARNEGISAISRSRAALASIDRRNRVGGTANGYLAGGELEHWATTVGFTDAPQGVTTALATRVPGIEKLRDNPVSVASLVTSGPSVKVIRVARR